MQWNQEGVRPLAGEVLTEGGVLLRGGDKWQDEPITPLSLTLQLWRLLLEKLLSLLQVSFLEGRDRFLNLCFRNTQQDVWFLHEVIPARCWWCSICTGWSSACWRWICKHLRVCWTDVYPGRASTPSDQPGQSSGQTAAADRWFYPPAQHKNNEKLFSVLFLLKEETSSKTWNSSFFC